MKISQDSYGRKFTLFNGPTGRPATMMVGSVPNRTRDDEHLQERFIAQDFADSLAHFHDRKILLLGDGQEPSDVDAEENGNRFGIQLKRVRDEDDEREQQLQRKYVDSTRNELGQVCAKLEGLQITLLGPSNDLLPSLNSGERGKEGRKLVQMLASEMHALANDLEALPNNAGLSCTWTNSPFRQVQGFVAWRFASSGGLWKFQPRSKRVEDIEALLADLIVKYSLMYGRSSRPLWLLLWEVWDGVGVYRERAAERARAILETRQTPFAEIWHFAPGVESVGSPFKIWPRQ